MRNKIAAVLGVAVVAALLQYSPASAHHCEDRSLGAFAQMGQETKAWGQFTDSGSSGGNVAGDHVPDWWSADDNYSSGCGRTFSADNEVIRLIVEKGANNTGNGDVSIFKGFEAGGSHSYSATATANLWNNEGTPYRAALKIAAWNSNGQIDEWKAWLCPTLNTHTSCDVADDDTWKTLSLGPINMPDGTTVVKVAFRGNGNLSSSYGVAGLERLTFTRNS